MQFALALFWWQDISEIFIHSPLSTVRCGKRRIYSMAKQDDYAKITLRIPKDLHASLVAMSEITSLNATIISLLYKAFDQSKGSAIHDKYFGYFMDDAGNMTDPDGFSNWFMKKLTEKTQEATREILKEAGALRRKGVELEKLSDKDLP